MISERPGSENYETTEERLPVFHVFQECCIIYSLLSPSGSRLEAPNSTSHRLHTLCRAWLLLKEFSHNRLQNNRQATISRPVLWLTLDALRFHAERRNDASGCTWLQEADPEGHGLWSATTSRRLPGPGFGAAHDGAHLEDPGPGLPAPASVCPPRNGERGCTHVLGGPARRTAPAKGTWAPRPRAQTQRHSHSPGPLEPAPSAPWPAFRPHSPQPLPHHSQGQLEEPREDQVVAGDCPAPTEKHHPGHGGGPAARARWRLLGAPRPPGSNPKPTATRRRRARGSGPAQAH